MSEDQDRMVELQDSVEAGVRFAKQGQLEPGYVKGIIVPKLKEVVIDKCRNIEKRHMLDGAADKEKSLVIHYTSIGALFSMLQRAAKGQNASLRLYDSVHLNDPGEGHILVRYFEQQYDWVKLEPRHQSHAYMASLVAPLADGEEGMEDELVYWLTYGRECGGCSLKLSIPNSLLRKVSYCADEANLTGKALLPVLNAIEPLASVSDEIRIMLVKGFFEFLEGIRYLYKSEEYRFENECRIIMGDSDVCRESICFEFNDKSPMIVRHYWEHEDLCIGEIFGSGSSITIGSRVPDFDDLKRSLEFMIN